MIALLEVVEAELAGTAIPALGFLILDNERADAAAFGSRRVDRPDIAATINDNWLLCSATKAMTALLVARVVDEGLISYDRTLSSIFGTSDTHPNLATVTINELLSHRSGLPRDIPLEVWGRLKVDGAPSRMELVRTLVAMPPLGSRGCFEYANAGYMIVGAALEAVLGETWETLITQRVFEPLGMSCGFGAPIAGVSIREPCGHAFVDGELRSLAEFQSSSPPALAPAGGIHSSLMNWARFLSASLDMMCGKTSIVSDVSRRRMLTPRDGIAHGWRVVERRWGNGAVYVQSGSNRRWYATAWLAPGRGVILAGVANCGALLAAEPMNRIVGTIANSYLSSLR